MTQPTTIPSHLRTRESITTLSTATCRALLAAETAALLDLAPLGTPRPRRAAVRSERAPWAA